MNWICFLLGKLSRMIGRKTIQKPNYSLNPSLFSLQASLLREAAAVSQAESRRGK